MSELRRAVITMAVLTVVCAVMAIFVFPGPSSPPQRLPNRPALAINNLGAVSPQLTHPGDSQTTAPPTTTTVTTVVPHRRNDVTTTTTFPPQTLPTDPPTTTTTVAPTTTTTAPSTECAGGTPDIGATSPMTNAPWKCTFDDEFSSDTLDSSKWSVQQTATSGYVNGDTACYVNSPNNVYIANGVLNLVARQESAPFLCNDPNGSFLTQETSGEVLTYQKFSQMYGLFEVRAKFPQVTVPGVQSTLWLWPDSRKYGPFPLSGEIDFAEWYSVFANTDIPYIHYIQQVGATDTNTTHCIFDPTQFHTFGVLWTPNSLSILVDGHTCMVDNWQPELPLTKPQPFDQPFFLNLTDSLGQAPNNAYNASTTPLPADLQIDWVRVWS